MNDPETWKKIRVLADELIATCEPQKFWDQINALTQQECVILDGMALECSVCNQFFDAHDMLDVDGQFVCSDCNARP